MTKKKRTQTYGADAHSKRKTPVASEAQRLRNEAAAQERAAQYDVTATCGLSYTYSSQATHRRSKHCDDVLELKTQERYDLLRQRAMMDDDIAEMEIA